MKKKASGLALIPAALAIGLVSLAACHRPGRPAPGPVAIGPADTIAGLEAKAARVVPSERQIRWQALEFQAFVHFGMNTFTDREWGEGTEDPRLFNPADLSAEQWVEAVKAAGIRGLVITAKHHDGFCLWPSRYTEHSVRNSPWKQGKGDVVGEAAAACRKGGLAFGVYLSPWDRHEPSYGDSPKYNQHFKDQLRELLTDYGEISEVWFDGACGEGPNGKRQVYDWPGYFALVRELQPKAAISIVGPDARWIGNEAGVTRPSEWSVIPVAGSGDGPDGKDPGGFISLDAQAQDLGSIDRIAEVARQGGRLIWYPGQVDVSIRPGWFYHAAEDDQVKPLDQLLDIYYTSVGGNAQLLLNIPPDKRGRIHENDVRRLKELGDRLGATFAGNLAAGARVTAAGSSTALQRPGRSGAVHNGDHPPGEAGQPEDRHNAAWIYDLGGPKLFNIAMIGEDIRYGQRVESFALDAWDGKDWKEIARGTTVGYKKLLRFPAVDTDRVRLRILRARGAVLPILPPASFGVFLDPSRHSLPAR
ncbi:MAG: alpha-L-fucosidase [Acidobacteriota bacterium]